MTTAPVPPEGNNLPAAYGELLRDLTERVRSARLRAAISVNSELIKLYWEIGREVLQRQEREGWGAKVIQRLGADLRAAFPDVTGFSPRNLGYMRAFAEAYPDKSFVQQVAAKLPWGHHQKLLDSVKSAEEREWYIRQAIEHGWSRAILANQVGSNLYARQGTAITNFERTLPATQSELAQELLKDPYNFDFLSLTADMLERDLENGLIENLKALFLELGKGFAFVGQQYHLEVGGQDYYLDLLFYHLKLRCYVVVELKIEEFKPEFAGKMNFYLSAVDDHLRHPSDAPSIGIILCRERNRVVVEYALRDANKPMGVAEYRLSKTLPVAFANSLPTVQEFARELPMMDLVHLRMQVERELRARYPEVAAQRPRTIASMIDQLREEGAAPASTARFMLGLRALHAASHAVDVEEALATEAREAAEVFLAELRALPGRD